MSIAFIITDYDCSIKEGSKLFKCKDVKLLDKNITKINLVKINFIDIKNIIKLAIEDYEDILIFLDSPYRLVNIFFSAIVIIKKLFSKNSKNFISYISIRGTMPINGAKKFLLKKFYWIIFSKLNFLLKYKLIASSAFEAVEIKKFFKYDKLNTIVVIPDIIFHKEYFQENSIKIEKYKQADNNYTQKVKSKDFKTIKILIPSRITQEKGVIEILNIIYKGGELNNYKNINLEFNFCCTQDSLYIPSFNKINFVKINFLGWMEIEDFLINLSNCDLVIIPSLYESFSIAAYQSLLMGKSIIISENSPWKFISKNFTELPISLCPPLLRGYDFEKLTELIGKTRKYQIKNNSKKFIQKCIETEAKSFKT